MDVGRWGTRQRTETTWPPSLSSRSRGAVIWLRAQAVRAAHGIERLDAHAVFKPRDRGLRGERIADDRVAAKQQLVNRVVGKAFGVVRIGMPAGEPEGPLCQQVLQRVPDLAGLPLVHEASREAVDQSIRSLGRLQQDGAAVGTRVLLIEGGNDRAIEKIRKENSLWYRLGRQRKRLRRG